MGKTVFIVDGPTGGRVILADSPETAFEETWERPGSIGEVEASVAIATADRIAAFQ